MGFHAAALRFEIDLRHLFFSLLILHRQQELVSPLQASRSCWKIILLLVNS